VKVTLDGTGAADGVPALFGRDRVSTHARAVGGRECRLRASATVDDFLKLDLPPETLAMVHASGADPTDWGAILFTHSDDDHFAKNQLQYALYPFCDADHPPFSVYGNAHVCRALHERFPDWPFEIQEIHPFVPLSIHGYQVTPIRANHSASEECLNFIIEREAGGLLYATDTGIYEEETFRFLEQRQLAAVVIECTDGRVEDAFAGHLHVTTLLQVVDRLRQSGAVRPDARIVTTHHSARGGMTYVELEAVLAPYQIDAGYDAMTFSVT